MFSKLAWVPVTKAEASCQKTKHCNRTQNLIAIMRCPAAIFLAEGTDTGMIACGQLQDYVAFQDGSYLLRSA